MSACATLAAEASAGIAPALRAVDCMAGEMTAAAFGRLFGAQGALAPALTILLTLYIAFFAVSLLTGRATLGISALTPRMMTLGLVLTFATSWIAYQGVLWNLATGAPDQIAGVLTGARGSATQIFADRIDMIFAAIAQAGDMAGGGQGAGQGAGQAAQGSFTPANLMWLAALLLLLGTVGVLVTARIALAVLLAVGPVFVVMALFSGTRGLTAGWLRGVVLTALVPLFVVVGGGLTVEMLVPIVANLVGETGVNGRAALALFLVASVHVALMAMLLKVSGTLVAGWRVFGLAGEAREGSAAPAPAQAMPLSTHVPVALAEPAGARRLAVATAAAPSFDGGSPAAGAGAAARDRQTVIVQPATLATAALPALARQRGRGVGSRFRAPSTRPREMIR